MAFVGELSLLVLAQDTKTDSKDKTKKKKSTGGSAPQTGTPGGKSDSY